MLRPTKHVTELINANKVWEHQLKLGVEKRNKKKHETLTMNQAYLLEYRDLLDEYKKLKKYINER